MEMHGALLANLCLSFKPVSNKNGMFVDLYIWNWLKTAASIK